jgi:2-phospho-L-lactate/phosphoenolpyruvate guanylyltransferase
VSALWAVVPVKELALAKTRLAPALDPRQRRAFMLAMLEDVMDALARSGGLAGIIVATLDAEAARLAQRFGARISRAAAGDGHSEAVNAAAQVLARENAAMLTLPADIPLLDPADVAAIIGASGAGGSGFVIVPARSGGGTNAVLCAPADRVPLRFGAPSFAAHVAAARAAGIESIVLDLPRVALDIDEPADLAAFRAANASCRARDILAKRTVRVIQSH